MDMKQMMQNIWDHAQHTYWEFIAESDEKSCPICKELDGTIFRDDDSEIPVLPLHPNCRCTLVKKG